MQGSNPKPRERSLLDRQFRLEWIGLGLAALILGGYLGWVLYTDHQHIGAEERARLLGQSVVLEQNLGGQLLAVARSLTSVREDLPLLNRQSNGKLLVAQRLRALTDAMPGVRTAVIVDADGTLTASNREQLVGQNFRQREIYQVVRQGKDPAALYVSPPYKTVLGVYAVTVAKVILDDGGAFAGAVAAILEPEYFKTLLNSVLYAPDMRASVIHGEGKVAFRVPDPQGIVGTDLAARPGAFFIEHMKSGREATTAEGIVASTGEARLNVFRTVRPAGLQMDKALVAVVSREVPALYSAWRKRSYEQGGLFGMLLLASAAGLLFYQRRRRAFERIVLALEDEQVRADAQLREHDARYRAVIESSSDGFWVADDEGRIRDVNDAYVRRSGYTRDELLGMCISDLEAEAAPEDTAARIEAVLSRGMDTFETVHRTKDGIPWPVEVSVRAQGGGSGRMLAFLRDISARKRAEALLRTRLRLTELAQTGSLDSLLQYALDAAEEVTGSSIGFFHYVDPDQQRLSLQAWSTNTLARMCTAEGKGQHYAISEAGVWVDAFHQRAPVIHNDYAGLAHKKGMPEGHAPVTRELVVPFIREGKVTEIMGVGNKAGDYDQADVEAVQLIAGMVQDLVERVRAEDALRESESRLAAIFQASPIAIVVSRAADGKILDCNDAALLMYGYAREEAIGRTVAELGTYAHLSQREELVRRLRERGSVERFTLDFRRRNGELGVLEVSGRIVELQGEQCLVALIMDVTERKRLEEVHLQAQKLESLGTLTGGIAHDFNNILAAIRGNADLAAEEVGKDHVAAQSLNEIRKASTRASELVRRIMAFGRPREAQQRTVDLGAVVGEVLKLLRSTLPTGISLLQTFAPDAPHVLADAGQIHEAIVNLTTNAAYAIGPRAGSIEYRLERVQVDDDLARRIPGLQPGRYARLTVTDSGCGMDTATLERIFDAFYTTKPLGEGTGLGLSMVHGIMRSHGGAVTVESTPGKGSSFALYFPAAQDNAQPDAVAAPAQIPLSAGQRVMYVDDEEPLVFLASRVLSRLGHSVSGYTDPKQALAAFRERPLDFDVVVTDLSMPHMSGFELAREVLALRPDTPVLMTSGYIRAEDESRARAAGIRELILKPVTMDELGRVLDRILRDSRTSN